MLKKMLYVLGATLLLAFSNAQALESNAETAAAIKREANQGSASSHLFSALGHSSVMSEVKQMQTCPSILLRSLW